MAWDRFLDKKHVEWARLVKERDNFICVICKMRGKSLESHHWQFNYASHPDQRYDLKNGATCCEPCHNLFHNLYGRENNSRYQFIEFMIIMRTIEKIIRKDLKNGSDGYKSSEN